MKLTFISFLWLENFLLYQFRLLLERWKMRVLRLMCDSYDPDFAKKLQEQITQAQNKQKGMQDTLKSLHSDIKQITNDCTSLAQARLYEVCMDF